LEEKRKNEKKDNERRKGEKILSKKEGLIALPPIISSMETRMIKGVSNSLNFFLYI